MPAGPIARVACPECGERFDLPYVLLGTSVECGACGLKVVPTVPEGERYPATGSELTFADFEQLINAPAYRRAVERLLRAWGYRLEGNGEATVVREGQQLVDRLELHLAIQAKEERRRALYQLAMSLWR